LLISIVGQILRDEFLSATKRLVDFKVASENTSFAKKEMETQYQKFDSPVLILN